MAEPAEIKIAEPLTVVGRRHELTFEAFSRIPALAGEAIPKIHDFLNLRGIRPSAPNIFEYRFHDSPHGPRRIRGGRFTLTLGVPVAESVDPPLPLEVIELPLLKYVEIITNSFGDDWRRVRDLAEQSGFARSLVEREVYLSWRGEGDPESKVALQVGIE
jgi:hypothetical protein